MSDPQEAVNPLVDYLRGLTSSSRTGVDINVVVNIHPSAEQWNRVTSQLDSITTQLSVIKAQGQTNMATIQDVNAKIADVRSSVERETTVNASVLALLQGNNDLIKSLKDQLAAAVASGDPTALNDVIAQLDAIQSANEANAAQLATAVAANTPAA